MVGLVHFSNFLIASEKYYKLQSYWITLYYPFETILLKYLSISRTDLCTKAQKYNRQGKILSKWITKTMFRQR